MFITLQICLHSSQDIVSREAVSAQGIISPLARSPTHGYSCDLRILISHTNIRALVPGSTGLSLLSCYQLMEVSCTIERNYKKKCRPRRDEQIPRFTKSIQWQTTSLHCQNFGIIHAYIFNGFFKTPSFRVPKMNTCLTLLHTPQQLMVAISWSPFWGLPFRGFDWRFPLRSHSFEVAS